VSSASERVRGTEPTFWAAPEIAKAGYPVFPISRKDKHPSVEGGFYAATTDLSEIAAWIQDGRGGHNIATPTGVLSQVVVIEADTPEMYAWMEERYGPPTVKTRRGGHWWFRHPRRGRVVSNAVREGLDRKGDGGYVLVPPSLGRTWTSGIPQVQQLPELPREFWTKRAEPTDAARSTPQARKGAAAAAIAARVARIPQGSRHEHLIHLCGVLLAREVPVGDAEDILIGAWTRVGGELAERAQREVANTLRTTEQALAERRATGVPKMEEITPGLYAELSEIMDWDVKVTFGGTSRNGHDGQKSPLGGQGPGVIKLLADIITGEDHFAQDAGGKLYRFAEGAYKQYAERYIRRRVKEVLEEQDAADKWSSHRANEVVEYIRADAPELWERPPLHEVNVLNGILDLETRRLWEHDPAFLSPVQIPVAFDPGAECPEWERFVADVFPEDARDLAFELAADLITPSRSAQKAILALGEGSNGKSTYLRALTAFVGSTNAGGVSLHKLESDRFATARLMGKLANICPDLPSTHLTETSVFKAITGNDDLHAEYKYRESFEFRPYCRLVFSANHVPRSGDASHAFFRRWLVVPFERTFEPGEQVPREVLDARLSSPGELSGVLNRALDVLPRVRRKGFTESESMREAWEEFKAMTDPVSVWLENNTVEHADALVPKSALLSAYNRDCEKQGRAGMTGKAFGQALKRARPQLRDAQRTVSGKLVWCWVGLGLRQDDRPPDGSPGSHHSRDSRDSTNCFGFEETPQEQDGSRERGPKETNKEDRVNRVNAVNGLAVADVLRVLEDARTGAHKNATLYAAGETKLDYLIRSVLFAKGIRTEDWQRYTDVVEAAFEEWQRRRA
jgi:P4 family phage/plasmid primase-like protien